MFTGIVQEVGSIIEINHQGNTGRILIGAPQTIEDAGLGDSICVNGTCLTVTSMSGGQFWADLSSETMSRTTFAAAKPGDPVNIEPSLRPIDRMGGHIVAGHVDGVGTLQALIERGEFWDMEIEFPQSLAPYIAEKGSIAVDGISLTIARVQENTAAMAIVPHTIQNTTLETKHPGAPVNLEADLIARYIERLQQFNPQDKKPILTKERLLELGY